MTVVDSVLEIPTPKENRHWWFKQIAKVIAAIMIAGGTITLVVITATNASQQKTIDRNNQASICRSQIVAETDGKINGSLALLLQDPDSDGLIEILDLILGTQVEPRQPPDYDQLGRVTQSMKDAQATRKAYVTEVVDAIARRESAIEACSPPNN
jgi:hypothetical protein